MEILLVWDRCWSQEEASLGVALSGASVTNADQVIIFLHSPPHSHPQPALFSPCFSN